MKLVTNQAQEEHINMNNENLKKLHANLAKKNPKFTRTFEEFAGDMGDVNNRERLYSTIKKTFNGFSKNKEEFYADMGFDAVEPVGIGVLRNEDEKKKTDFSIVPLSTKLNPIKVNNKAAVETLYKDNVAGMTKIGDATISTLGVDYDMSKRFGGGYKDTSIESTPSIPTDTKTLYGSKKQLKPMTSVGVDDNAILMPADLKRLKDNPEYIETVGQDRQRYKMPVENKKLREQILMEYGTNRAYEYDNYLKSLSLTTNQLNKAEEDYNKRKEAFDAIASKKLYSPLYSATESERNELEKKAKTLSLEGDRIKQAKDALSAYQDGKDVDAGLLSSVGKMLGGTAADVLSYGLIPIAKGAMYNTIADKKAKGEKLTEDESKLLNTAAISQYIQDAYSERTFGQEVGETVMGSIPFMASFVQFGGLTNGVSKLIGKGATKLGMKAITKEGIKDAGKAGLRGLEGGISKNVAKSLGVVNDVVDNVVKMGGILTVLDPRTYGKAVENMNGKAGYDIDDNTGQIVYTGQEDSMNFKDALMSAYTTQAIENLSEASGIGMEAIAKPISKTITSFVGKKLPELTRMLKDSNFLQWTGAMAEKAQWNGTMVEFMENNVSTMMHAALGTGQGEWEDLIDPKSNALNLATTMLIGSGGYLANQPGRMVEKQQIKTNYKVAEREFDNYFGEDAEAFKDRFKNGTVDERNNTLISLLLDKNKDNEARKVILDYFTTATRYGAFEEARNQIVENAVVPAVDEVNSQINEETGTIVHAIVNGVDTKINGNVVFMEDGTIDKDNSTGLSYDEIGEDGQPIVVNGVVSQIPIAAKDLSNPTQIDPIQARETAVNAATQPLIDQFANEDAPEYKVNDEVRTISGMFGKITQVTPQGYVFKAQTGEELVVQGKDFEDDTNVKGIVEDDVVEYMVDGVKTTGTVEDINAGRAIGEMQIDGNIVKYSDIVGKKEEETEVNEVEPVVEDDKKIVEEPKVESEKEGVLPNIAPVENQEVTPVSPDLPQIAPPKTFAEQIPTKKVGKKTITDYEAVAPEITAGALKEDFEDYKEVNEIIDVKIKDFEKQIKSVGVIKKIADIDQYKANVKAAKEKVDALTNQLEYWKAVKEAAKPIDKVEVVEIPLKETKAQRLERWGEPRNLNELIMYKIIDGQKIRWDDVNNEKGVSISKGLGAEYRNSNSERLKRYGILSPNGFTPEQFAHDIWEANAYEEGQFDDMPLFGIDTQEILDKILDVLNTYISTGQMISDINIDRAQLSKAEQARLDQAIHEADAEIDNLSDDIYAEVLGLTDLTAEQLNELNTLQNETDRTTEGTSPTIAETTKSVEQDNAGQINLHTGTSIDRAELPQVKELIENVLNINGVVKEVKFMNGDEMLQEFDGTEQKQTLPEFIEIDGVKRHTTNSNGKQIANTEQGVRNFWKWFGESKVVDEQGRPLVVYHGGASSVTNFDSEKAGEVKYSDWGKGVYFTPSEGYADMYRADYAKSTDKIANRLYDEYVEAAKALGTTPMDKSVDLGYGSEKYNSLAKYEKKWRDRLDKVRNTHGEVYSVYLNISNPLEYRYEGMTDPYLSQTAKDSGNDGIIVRPMTEYIVFSPTQIKSATANSGEFDPNNADIRYMKDSTDKKTVLGAVKNGVVYINTDTLNLNTPIHEFGHIFIDAIDGTPLFNKGAELIKQSVYFTRLANDPNYSHLSENGRVKEAMAAAIGDNGAQVVKDKGFYAKLKKWISDVWKRIGAKAGIENLTPEQISNLSLQDFIDITTSEVLSGKKVAQIEKENPLIVIHNIRAEGIINADNIGGLPMPSLAITRADMPLSGYGEISLIGNKNLVDPKKGTKTFGADIYSARYPSVEYELGKDSRKLIEKEVSFLPAEIESAVWHRIEANAKEGLSDLRNSNALKTVWLAKQGKLDEIIAGRKSDYSDNTVNTISEIKGYDYLDVANNDEVKQVLKDLYFAEKPHLVEYADKFTDETGYLKRNVASQFFNEVKGFLRTKDRFNDVDTYRNASDYIVKNNLENEWGEYATNFYNSLGIKEKLFKGYNNAGYRKYVDHTIENVVKAMKTKNLRGAENFFYGAGSVRARVAPEFKSIADIKKNAGKLVSKEDFEKVKDEVDAKLSNLTENLDEFHKYKGNSRGNITEALSEDIVQLANYGRSESFNQLSDEVRTELVEFIEMLKNAPTEYFEAKPTRAVSLSEFTAAVVPTDTEQKVIKILEDAGLKVEKYDGNRAEVVERVSKQENVQFQIIGEQGASNLDKAEEAIIRLDNLKIAKEMEATKTPQEIRMATGWEKGADGKWKYEVMDVEINDKHYSDLLERKYTEDIESGLINATTLGELYDSKELYSAYPELENMQVILYEDDNQSASASYNPNEKAIYIYNPLSLKSIEGRNSNLIHEIQHAIQSIEGFAKGGNTESVILETEFSNNDLIKSYEQGINHYWTTKEGKEVDAELDKFVTENPDFTDIQSDNNDNELIIKYPNYQTVLDALKEISKQKKLPKNSIEAYKRLAGEVEARNASTRMNMTEEERRQTLLSETEYVARDEQIVMFDEPVQANSQGEAPTGENAAELNARIKRKSTLFGLKLGSQTSFVESVIDAWTTVKQMEDFMRSKGMVISDNESFYKQATHTSGRIAAWLEVYENAYLKPLQKTIHDMVNKGVTYQDVERFAMITHGLEERNPFFNAKEIKEQREDAIKNATERIYRDRKRDAEEVKKLIQEVTDKINSNKRFKAETKNKRIADAIKKIKTEVKKTDAQKEEMLKKAIDKINKRFDLALEQSKMSKDDVLAYWNNWHAEKLAKIDSDFEEHGVTNAQYYKKVEQLDKRRDFEIARSTMSDYSGITAFEAELGDLPTWLNNFKDKVGDDLINKFWGKVKENNDFVLDVAVRTGMMNRDFANDLKARWNKYVPLRGFDGVTAEDVHDYTPNMGVFFTAPMQKIKGRKSIAETPFAYMSQMAQSAIVAGEKNIGKQAFARLAKKDTTGLIRPSKSWYQYVGEVNGVKEFELAEPTYSEDAEQFNKNIDDFEERMQTLRSQGLAYEKNENPDFGFVHIKKAQKEQHAVRVSFNGKESTYYVMSDPRISRAINGNMSELSPLMKVFRTMTSGQGQIYTSKNPLFVITNAERDFTYAVSTLIIKEGKEYEGKFLKNLPKSGKALRKVLYGNAKELQEKDPQLYKMYQEYVMNGGKTGYFRLFDLKKSQEAYEKSVAKGDKKSVAKITFDAIGAANEFAETINRFSVYMTSREMGKSIVQSVDDAKNVTLNFDMKGTGDGAWKYFKAIYAFQQVAVNALANITNLGIKNPKGLASLVATYTTLGVLEGLMSALLGGDDGDDKYASLSPMDRRNNMQIYTPYGFIKWFLPQELRIAKGLGSDMYLWSRGKLNGEDLTWSLISNIADLLPVNIAEVGEGGYEHGIKGAVAKLAPTALAPEVQLALNLNFKNDAIVNGYVADKKIPGFRKARVNKKGKPYAPAIVYDLSKWLNYSTGGDDVVPGKVSFNPDIVHHLLSGHFGGLYKLGVDAASSASNTAQGKEITVRDTPLGKFFTSFDDLRERNVGLNNSYYDIRNDIKQRFEYRNKYFKELGFEASKPKIEDLGITEQDKEAFGYIKMIERGESRLDDVSAEEQDLIIKTNNELKKLVIKIKAPK